MMVGLNPVQDPDPGKQGIWQGNVRLKKLLLLLESGIFFPRNENSSLEFSEKQQMSD